MTPTLDVVEMNANAQLLAGSDPSSRSFNSFDTVDDDSFWAD